MKSRLAALILGFILALPFGLPHGNSVMREVPALGPVLGISPALALQAHEVLPDPAMEARAREISAKLRCMVCQNQSIDDSNAQLARDLRTLVRERLVEGDTNKEVIDFLVARYGDYVLLSPPFRAYTMLLWGAPVLLLLLGLGLTASVFKRGRKSATNEKPAPLTAEEEAQLKSLLKDSAE